MSIYGPAPRARRVVPRQPRMDTPIQDVDARLAAALADEPSRIPVLLGPCGSGRTRALRRLRDRLPAHTAQYVDVERVVSTPERFLERLTAGTPFVWQPPPGAPDGPREAYARVLSYFARARIKHSLIVAPTVSMYGLMRSTA